MADEKKSWLDEKLGDAKEKAAAEAGKALVNGVVGAAGAQLDSWLGAMEGELARRQQLDVSKPTDPEEAPPPPARPSAEDRQQASAAELVRLKAQAQRAPRIDMVDEPAVAPSPASLAAEADEPEEFEGGFEELEEEPAGAPASGSADQVRQGVEVQPVVEPWVRPDPMAAAEAALEKARQARRGAGIPEPVEVKRPTPVGNERRDPFAAAREALEKAQAARASVGRSAVQIDREERARKELEELKGMGRSGGGGGGGGDPTPDPPKPADTPKRRL